MLGELTLPRTYEPWTRRLVRWHTALQYTVAVGALLGVAFLCGIMLSKTVFLGSDSANNYAHVWYLYDRMFFHARLPLHVTYLESGRALTFPYAVVPWTALAIPFALMGDRAVTIGMVAGFAFYGYAAVTARPALRDPRLLALVYANTFLIEGLVSFQLPFIYACAFFFMFVSAVDDRRWAMAAAWALLAITTHPFAGVASVAGYAVYACGRRPRDVLPLAGSLAVVALVVLPFALYIRTTPAVDTTRDSDIVGTLKFMARYRGTVILAPLAIAAFAPVLRPAFLPAFLAMSVLFVHRIDTKQVNTFGLDRTSHPFYGDFLKSPQFDRSLTYRVLEPNDREDGAYQLMRSRVVVAQEFFDQSQFRRWWNTPDQYACFLGAKHVDVVLLEKDYPLKFSENESVRLAEFERQGKATTIYRDPRGRFTAFDVRGARREGAKFSECKL